MADSSTSKSYGFSVDPPMLPGSRRRSVPGSADQDALLIALGHGLVLILLSFAVIPPALSALGLEPLSVIARLALGFLLGFTLVKLSLSFLGAVRRSAESEL